MSKFVYILYCQGFFKVGISVDTNRRIKEVQTGNPFAVKLIAELQTNDADIIEKKIHAKYNKKRVRNEWFEFDQEDFFNVVHEYGFDIVGTPEIPKVPTGLFNHGFGDPFCKVQTLTKPVSTENMQEIRLFIRDNWTKCDKWYTRMSSYGLKSLIERSIGKYVSNGQLIKAMILEGFLYKRGSVNAQFNVSHSSIANIEKRLKQ